MKRRILALLMLVCMVWGVFPVQASALDYTWKVEAIMANPRVHASAVAVDNEIVIIGGTTQNGVNVDYTSASNAVFVYNTEDGKWRNAYGLPEARTNVITGVIDGKIYVIGGVTTRTNVGAAIYSAYPGMPWHTELDEIPSEFKPGLFNTGAVYGRNLYIVDYKGITIYNVDDKSFTLVEGPEGIANYMKAVECDGKIHIFGSNIHIIFDCETNSWSYGENMPVYLGTQSFSTFAKDGRIYVLGGFLGSSTQQNPKDIYIYDVTADEWTQGKPSLLEGRIRFSTVVAGDRVYVIGGATRSNNTYNLNNKVESISLEDLYKANGIVPEVDYKAFIKLSKNDTLEIDVDDADYTDFIWESSNNSVAAINNGVIIGVDEGIANIRITSNNGKFHLNIPVKVVDNGISNIPVTDVEISPSSIRLEVDEAYQLNYQVYPTNATDQGVTWQSGNDAVAVVDANGYVTAIAPGTAEITITTVDGSHTDICFVTVEETAVTPPVEPENLALLATATASSELNNNRRAAMANDGDEATSWMAAANDEEAFLLLDFGRYVELNQVVLKEVGNRIGDYNIEIWDGSVWVEVYSGTRIGAEAVINLDTTYTTTGIRINMFNKWNANNNAYALYEFEVYNR